MSSMKALNEIQNKFIGANVIDTAGNCFITILPEIFETLDGQEVALSMNEESVIAFQWKDSGRFLSKEECTKHTEDDTLTDLQENGKVEEYLIMADGMAHNQSKELFNDYTMSNIIKVFVEYKHTYWKSLGYETD